MGVRLVHAGTWQLAQLVPSRLGCPAVPAHSIAPVSHVSAELGFAAGLIDRVGLLAAGQGIPVLIGSYPGIAHRYSWIVRL